MSRIPRLVARILLLCSPLAAACRLEEGPCRDFVRTGDALKVVVLGPDDAGTSSVLQEDLPPCAIDDVHAGDVFELRVGGRVMTHNFCYDFACPADFPSASEPLEQPPRSVVLNYVCLSRDRKIQIAEDCEVDRFVALYAPRPDPDIYAPATADGSTPVQMVRALSIGSPDAQSLRCDALPDWVLPELTSHRYFCANVWRVELQKSN